MGSETMLRRVLGYAPDRKASGEAVAEHDRVAPGASTPRDRTSGKEARRHEQSTGRREGAVSRG